MLLHNISNNCVLRKKTINAWVNLKEHFAKADRIRVSNLHAEISNLKQGSKFVLYYFTKMQGLWEELDSYRPMPICMYVNQCIWEEMCYACDFHLENQIIQFSKGLNDKFLVIKTQVLLMEKLLPSINKIYYMFI